MKSRWLTLIAAVGFALSLSGQALAKPPEEEAIDRAEKAAERAAKAAERAAEAAERAAERDASDRDKNRRDGDRASKGDKDQRSDNKSGGDKDGKVELASVKTESSPSVQTSAPDGDAKLALNTSGGDTSTETSGSTPGSSGDDEDDIEDESRLSSGSTPGSSGDDGDDDSHDGSGSNSGSDDDDHSGSDSNSGSGGGDDDDDEDQDDDNKNQRDRSFGIVPIENDDAGNPYREGELVIMSDDAGLVKRAEALGFGVIEARPLESIGAVVARLRRPEGVTSNQALAMLRTNEPQSASGYNYLYRTTGKKPVEPDDKHQDTSAPTPVREKAKTGAIGVIDGFSSDAIAGWKVERLVEKPAMEGHGDAVTGILLRDLANAYRAEPDRLMLMDVMRGQSNGGAADVTALVVAFDKLVTAHVGVVNLSLAGPDHPALQRAVSQSQKSGMIVVAAVGNGGPAAPPAFPAAYDGVVGVAAVDSGGKPYIYSGRGAHVDIAALGVEVSSTEKGGELVGTSYAAPHVTAMIAGERRQQKSISVDGLLAQYAEDAGAPGRDPVYGLGILTLDKPARLAQAAQTSN